MKTKVRLIQAAVLILLAGASVVAVQLIRRGEASPPLIRSIAPGEAGKAGPAAARKPSAQVPSSEEQVAQAIVAPLKQSLEQGLANPAAAPEGPRSPAPELASPSAWEVLDDSTAGPAQAETSATGPDPLPPARSESTAPESPDSCAQPAPPATRGPAPAAVEAASPEPLSEGAASDEAQVKKPAGGEPAPAKAVGSHATAEVCSGLVVLLAREKQSFWGYSANDLWVGTLMANQANRQRGELVLIRAYLGELCGLARPAGSEAVERVRAELARGDLDEWVWARGERRIDRGIQGLQAMAAGIESGAIKLPGDAEGLAQLLGPIIAGLKAETDRLANEPPGWFGADDLFSHAQGVAVAGAELARGLEQGLAPALDETGAKSDLIAARAALDQAAALDPRVILGPSGDYLGGNDLAAISTLLGQARDRLAVAQAKARKE